MVVIVVSKWHWENKSKLSRKKTYVWKYKPARELFSLFCIQVRFVSPAWIGSSQSWESYWGGCCYSCQGTNAYMNGTGCKGLLGRVKRYSGRSYFSSTVYVQTHWIRTSWWKMDLVPSVVFYLFTLEDGFCMYAHFDKWESSKFAKWLVSSSFPMAKPKRSSRETWKNIYILWKSYFSAFVIFYSVLFMKSTKNLCKWMMKKERLNHTAFYR